MSAPPSPTDPALVRAVLARVFVEAIDPALPVYQRLSGGAEVRRFAFGGIDLAWVGPFLLLAGDDARERFGDRVASLVVSSMDAVVDVLRATAATILDGPSTGPNGARLIARHADGSIFEYLQVE